MNRRRYRLATLGLAAIAAVACWTLSTQLFPYHSLNHDEAVYLQQAAMLLEGQLTLQPPLEDVFRPWFFVDGGEHLYPKYAPVPAAIYALGALAGGYRLALPAIAAGLVVLAITVTREVFDRPTGLLTGGIVLASPLFLVDTSVFLPYAPTTLLNLAFAAAYLRADRTGDARWAAIAGAAVGLAFFARPYTAVLFAAPFVGHAGWTLYDQRRGALPRQLATAVLGLAGVATALVYNAILTGSPWRFPYQAFAPRDGIGFGERELLGYAVTYTPELALRANARVLELFFTDWLFGGLLTAGLAAVGLTVAARDHRTARTAALAGLLLTVPLGNLYFWGNLNVLGDLARSGDGLVAAFGPYYHFDLLVPTAAFAAHATRRLASRLRTTATTRVSPRHARALVVLALLLVAGAAGTITAGDLDDAIETNARATETYRDAYAPFRDGPPPHSIVLLPAPYGEWLHHPFQPLRNDPRYDGPVLYALDDRPFDTLEAFPDRAAYRYGYRGPWAPTAGSPDAARLQRLRTVAGDRVHLNATVGVPDGAVGVTARLSTDEGAAYYVATPDGDRLKLRLAVTPTDVSLAGDVRPLEDSRLALGGTETVRLTVFVDYGPAGGFSYRFDLPVQPTPGGVRAITPRIERCRRASACGGAATYIPEAAPPGVFVRTSLNASDGRRDPPRRHVLGRPKPSSGVGPTLRQ